MSQHNTSQNELIKADRIEELSVLTVYVGVSLYGRD